MICHSITTILSLHEQITSQNPYAEVFVGEPFVQTVNINNMDEVEEALRKIMNSSVGLQIEKRALVTIIRSVGN